MLNTPFSPWPSFTQEEADAVSRVLLSNKVNYWTGQECREFEKEFAAWCGTEKAIAIIGLVKNAENLKKNLLHGVVLKKQ